MSARAARNPNPKIAHKQLLRRQQLLDAAAEQINAVGAGAVNLDAVAKEAGFTRNALYYYVADRNDLAFQCFEQSCAAVAGDLEDAVGCGTDPVERIKLFVISTLAPDRAAIAVLGEHDFLAEPKRSVIRDKTRAICAGVADIIQQGTDTGHFRAVDPAIAARCLIGMLNWARLASRWLGEPSTADVQARLARAVVDVMLSGFAIAGAGKPPALPDAVQLTTEPFNAFDRDEATREKRAQLLGAASRLFNRHGIDGTSINDIAAAVGATKGALYHYFDDKNDLVVRCYERAFEIYDRFIEVANRTGATGFQKLMITHHLNCQAQAGGRPPLILQTGMDALPDAVRPLFVRRSRKIWCEVQEFMAAGRLDGSCRDAEPKSHSQVAVGAFAWIARADELVGGCSPIALADTIGDIIGFGILRR